MLKQIVESFLSKVGEKLVDCAQHIVMGDHKFTLDTLQKNLQLLISKASDVEAEIKNAELFGRKKRKRQVDNWLSEVQKLESEFLELENEVQSGGFVSRFFGGDRATKLNARIYEMVEESRHLGELVLDVYENKGEALLTTRMAGQAFEENLERIWRLLMSEKLSRIGIYGMGGVGKTTFAKRIHNRFLDKHYYVFWITVSQVFSIKKLQDEIAGFVGLNLSKECDENKRAARLHRALSRRKNFLLVLDDVWQNISLEKLGYPLSVDWCKLIITTRSLKVCHQIGCQEVIVVKTLDANEAWNLFLETLGREMTLTSDVEEIAKCMARECDGLPLGIITLAGSMRGETDIHVWRNALVELKESEDMEEQVFKVFKYSFDQLGQPKLQLCFLYCCLYPEDYKIDREELISRFISEELLDRKSREGQIDQGHAILNKLVNVCLLESITDDNGHAFVKMHNLVRGMAMKITQGKTVALGSLKEISNGEE